MYTVYGSTNTYFVHYYQSSARLEKDLSRIGKRDKNRKTESFKNEDDGLNNVKHN